MKSLGIILTLSFAIVNIRSESISGTSDTSKDESQITCFDDKLAFKVQSWVKTDTKCTDDKSEILKFCQSSYPKLDISNIVQVDEDTWHCLEGPFQSEALLVPSQCIFDHLHNSSICQGSYEWNSTAKESCFMRDMKLKSYSVLLPCGIGLFTGVEFVCCPVQEVTTEDPYFLKYNVKNEHENFIEAEERLESKHRDKIDKIMQEWNGLEERYQETRRSDPQRAEKFKKTVTERFQKTIKALEEEDEAEKKQLISIHQQRIHSALNEKKRESLECFTNAISDRPQSAIRIKKCLEKLMRILNKSRHHVISHYKHLQRKSPAEADDTLDTTLQRLEQISKTARDSLDQVDRYPNLRDVRTLVEDYVNSLQGTDDYKTVLDADRDSDMELLSRHSLTSSSSSTSSFPSTASIQQSTSTISPVASPSSTTTSTSTEAPPSQSSTSGSAGSVGQPPIEEEVAEQDQVVEQQQQQEINIPQKIVTPQNSHSGKFDFTNEQPSYIMRREVYHKENKTIYITMAFAGLAVFGAMVIGLYVLRKRGSPQGRGFLQVSVGTPEEKHVANMQINGYENPTYKYFETEVK